MIDGEEPRPAGTTAAVYCTILSSNYLPRALALAGSVRRQESGARLAILFIDIAEPERLPALEEAECLSTDALGIDRRTLLQLAMAYDLVELATAVKPLLLARLLEHAETVVYLDPDMYVTSLMAEIAPALAESPGGILLTPHFLLPVPPEAGFNEGHMLFAGVYNLGFCAVDRRAGAFLDWWWEHLRHESLYDPLSGVFYDQKWMDIGSMLFRAGVLRHFGYNVGVANLAERPIALGEDGYSIESNGVPLRLFHFHAFDWRQPDRLSTRFDTTQSGRLAGDSAVRQLCREYGDVLAACEERLPPAPPYPYQADSRARPISRQLRRVYRLELQDQGSSLPLPFEPSEAHEYERWRRGAWRRVGRALLGDAAKCLRMVLPEEYDRFKRRFPAAGKRLGSRFSSGSGLWH